jgi:uncharacterized protein with PQ loop repeat
MPTQHHSFHLHMSKKKQKNVLDRIVGVAAFLYPMTALPQIILVFRGEVDGVSIVSWVGFLIFSSLFLIYGLVHRIKPMIVTNVLWVSVDSLIIFGVVAHQMM